MEPTEYTWNQSHGYSLDSSVDWQVVSWWSYAYNAMRLSNTQYGQEMSTWYAATQKEMVMEQEAAEGLLVLSSLSSSSNIEKPPRRTNNSISRTEMYQIFGKTLDLPMKCTIKIEVDGKIVSKRACEIRSSNTTSMLYMTCYSRTPFIGMYDRGLRLDGKASASAGPGAHKTKNVTLVRVFTTNATAVAAKSKAKRL